LSLTLRSVFGGILFGKLSNIAIVASGYSIWVGLLCQSVFGAMGMALVLAMSVTNVKSRIPLSSAGGKQAKHSAIVTSARPRA
jgi:hypothetical protein